MKNIMMQSAFFSAVLLISILITLQAAEEAKQSLVSVLRLPRPVHPGWGQELPGGNRLAYDRGSLYVSRRFGISRFRLQFGLWDYIPLPLFSRAGQITSFSVIEGVIRAVTADGLVLVRSRSGRWSRFLSENFRNVHCSAVSGRSYLVADGGVRRFPGKRLLFQLPFGQRFRSNRLLEAGGWWYLCSDSGLYRFSIGSGAWETAGVRDHLSRANIQDGVLWRNGLVLVSSRSQYPRISANIKLTSYGTFVYNYFQKRWDRIGKQVSPEQKRFLKLNRKNRSLPPGGVWVYYPPLPFSIKETVFLDYRMRIAQSQVVATLPAASAAALLARFYRKRHGLYQLRRTQPLKEAWRLSRVLEVLGYREQAICFDLKGLDFFRILKIGEGKFWTATRRGVWEFRFKEGQGSFHPVAAFRKRFTDDLLRLKSRIAVLSGDTVFLVDISVENEKQGEMQYTELSKREKKSSPPVKAEDISEVGRFVHQMELYLKRGGVD